MNKGICWMKMTLFIAGSLVTLNVLPGACATDDLHDDYFSTPGGFAQSAPYQVLAQSSGGDTTNSVNSISTPAQNGTKYVPYVMGTPLPVVRPSAGSTSFSTLGAQPFMPATSTNFHSYGYSAIPYLSGWSPVSTVPYVSGWSPLNSIRYSGLTSIPYVGGWSPIRSIPFLGGFSPLNSIPYVGSGWSSPLNSIPYLGGLSSGYGSFGLPRYGLPSYGLGGYNPYGTGFGFGGIGNSAAHAGSFGNFGAHQGTVPNRVIQTGPTPSSGNYYKSPTSSSDYYASDAPPILPVAKPKSQPKSYWGPSESDSWGATGNPFPKDLNSVPWAK